MIENPMRFVREMKGAPLSVVVLLALTNLALTNQAICTGTGYSDKTVAGALEYLEGIGMVVRAAGGWRIAEGVQLALPLAAEEIEEGDNSDDIGGSRKISDSAPIVNIVVNDSNINDLSLLTIYSEPESEIFRLNLEAMAECGIQATEKTRALARREYVTPVYVLSHVEQVKREGQRTGLAIWRMEKGMEQPLRLMSTGHFEGCRCRECEYVEKWALSAEEALEWFRGEEVVEDVVADDGA